jgi:hypothetical protein
LHRSKTGDLQTEPSLMADDTLFMVPSQERLARRHRLHFPGS